MNLSEQVRALETRLEVWAADGYTYLGIGDTDGIGCRNETIKLQDARIAALEARCRDAEAKVAWLEGKEIAVCGYPWDQPYQDGYDSAKGEYQERIRELGAALDDVASRTDYDRDACGKRAADALAAAETTVNDCGLSDQMIEYLFRVTPHDPEKCLGGLSCPICGGGSPASDALGSGDNRCRVCGKEDCPFRELSTERRSQSDASGGADGG